MHAAEGAQGAEGAQANGLSLAAFTFHDPPPAAEHHRLVGTS